MSSAQLPESYGVTRVAGFDGGSLVISGYDSQDDMVKVKSVQKKFRDSFTAAQVRVDYWDTAIGAGGALSQSAGTLVMGSGTTANAVTSILSKQTFTVPFRLSIGLTLSQRIVDQTFIAEMISVDPATGVPDGQHAAALYFDGVTPTLAKYVVQNGGITPLTSAAVAFASTAANGVYELEPFADESWFHSGTLDATTGRVNSYRRHQQIPDPNALYKIRLRWANGAVAPASTTNATIQYLAVQDYAELTAEITAGRGQTTAGQGLGVNIIGTPAFFVTGQAAHDAVATGNPVRVAARALSAAYTTVATGDSADLVSTLQGVLVTRPWQIPELEWSYASAAGGITNTTDVVLAAAPAAGLRRYITSMDVKNLSATATEAVLKDGATVIWRGHLSASMTLAEQVNFANPLKTTAATALNFACITTGAQVYINAQGYIAA